MIVLTQEIVDTTDSDTMSTLLQQRKLTPFNAYITLSRTRRHNNVRLLRDLKTDYSPVHHGKRGREDIENAHGDQKKVERREWNIPFMSVFQCSQTWRASYSRHQVCDPSNSSDLVLRPTRFLTPDSQDAVKCAIGTSLEPGRKRTLTDKYK